MSKNKNAKPDRRNGMRDIAGVVVKECDMTSEDMPELATYRMISLEDDIANNSQS